MSYPGLPKWPQMYTTGVSVSIEQAKEIIRRTDTYFTSPDYAGNDRVKRLEIPVYDRSKPMGEYFDAMDLWCERWGYIQTGYVHNTWIAAAFIFGPHGWCHPDGKIGYIDNVGKWPSCEAIIDDWKLLVSAFPFIEVDVTLMSGEDCEEGTVPVFGIRVYRGSVEPCDPGLLHKDHERAGRWLPWRDGWSDADYIRTLFETPLRERGVPWSWIEDWAEGRRNGNGN